MAAVSFTLALVGFLATISCVLAKPGYASGHGAVSYQNNNLEGGHGWQQGGGGKDYYAHPKYSYHYGVSDSHTKDMKTASEQRDGDNVKGHYSLLEPDGSWRTVNYVADGHGFKADVQRTKGHHDQGQGQGQGHGWGWSG